MVRARWDEMVPAPASSSRLLPVLACSSRYYTIVSLVGSGSSIAGQATAKLGARGMQSLAHSFFWWLWCGFAAPQPPERIIRGGRVPTPKGYWAPPQTPLGKRRCISPAQSQPAFHCVQNISGDISRHLFVIYTGVASKCGARLLCEKFSTIEAI